MSGCVNSLSWRLHISTMALVKSPILYVGVGGLGVAVALGVAETVETMGLLRVTWAVGLLGVAVLNLIECVDFNENRNKLYTTNTLKKIIDYV